MKRLYNSITIRLYVSVGDLLICFMVQRYDFFLKLPTKKSATSPSIFARQLYIIEYLLHPNTPYTSVAFSPPPYIGVRVTVTVVTVVLWGFHNQKYHLYLYIYIYLYIDI